mmetsp:Transcript_4951/g.6051  ORF Transcript_4951/g.6051 Transcript_4951/m.6051 type:complete len:100 (-) Transcript_4951:207-506(-)
MQLAISARSTLQTSNEGWNFSLLCNGRIRAESRLPVRIDLMRCSIYSSSVSCEERTCNLPEVGALLERKIYVRKRSEFLTALPIFAGENADDALKALLS